VRILIHGLNFAPELVGVGKYTGEMAEWLAQRGHQVRVVCAPPFNPECKVWNGYSGWKYAREHFEHGSGDLTVFRCPLFVPRRPSAKTRLLHLASFALSSLPLMLGQIRWRPDVVIAIEPTLFCLPAAGCCARWTGAVSWLHIQDFEVDAAFELGLMGSPRLRRIIEGMERKSMSRLNRVSTISQRMLEKLAQKGVDPAHRVMFENWVDTSQIYPLPGPSPMRSELGISDQSIVAMYSGSMGNKQGLDILLDAARRLASHQQLQFVFCGDGPARPRLAAAAAEMGNIHWLPLQPLSRLNDLLNLADIHLLPQLADAADLVMPSKLTGILASGRPVLTTAHPGTQLASAVQGRGLVVPPEDAIEFTLAIERLAADEKLRQDLGHKARQYAVSNWQTNKILSRFEQDLYASMPLAFSATTPKSILSATER
jgi:colanic acid biosynthesis glycosyl transferase WcaI